MGPAVFDEQSKGIVDAVDEKGRKADNERNMRNTIYQLHHGLGLWYGNDSRVGACAAACSPKGRWSALVA